MPDSSSAASELRWSGDVPELRSPILIAAFEGWNDAGDAATTAAQHLATRLDATPLAEIDPELYYDFSTTRPFVQLNGNRERSLTWPSNEIVYARIHASPHDVVILCGLEPQLRWRSFCDQVLATAEAVGATSIITLGALLADVPHTRPVELYGTSDDPILMEQLELSASDYEGPTGIVGVLSTAAGKAGFPTASIWAAVPSYVPGVPSPKAALALVTSLCLMIDATVYVTDLEIEAAAYEHQVDEIVAEDADTTAYIVDLEEQWDKDRAKNFGDHKRDRGEDLDNDPELLVAEVERFLRDVD